MPFMDMVQNRGQAELFNPLLFVYPFLLITTCILGGTLLVSVGHVSLDNDDLDGYQPYLLFECDNVEGQDTLRKGPHRDVQSPQLVPWGVVGGSDITFAVRAECKFLTVALWDESAIHQKFNKELSRVSRNMTLKRKR